MSYYNDPEEIKATHDDKFIYRGIKFDTAFEAALYKNEMQEKERKGKGQGLTLFLIILAWLAFLIAVFVS